MGKWGDTAPGPPPSTSLVPAPSPSLRHRLLTFAPRLCCALEYFVHTRFNPAFSLRNRRSFRRVDPRRLASTLESQDSR